MLAALALPPLAALLVAAWFSYRRLLAPVLVATALFGVAALVTLPGLHLALAAPAFAATVAVTALVHRPGRVPFGNWRDYVTLTKPRIMTLLLLTGFCGMVAGAHGLPAGTWPSARWSAWRWPAEAPARSTTCSTVTSTG